MKLSDIDKSKLTPMMQQYSKIKEENLDKVLFYRLGDFYELFFEDAILVSKELEIVLTGKDCGLDERAPMAGIPYHSSKSYLNKMVEKGYKVAIAEQIGDPKLSKGIVERAVVKVVSPGTILDIDSAQKSNNYLASIYIDNDSFGLSYVDITTGEFYSTESLNTSNIERSIINFLSRVNPKEILLNRDIKFKTFSDYLKNNRIYITQFDASINLKKASSLIKTKIKSFDENLYKDKIFSTLSSSMLVEYIYSYRKENLAHISDIKYINSNKYMSIDANTKNNLEISRNLSNNSISNTLLDLLDRSVTPMGSRKISSWLDFPLLEQDKINDRLDIVEHLFENAGLRNSINEVLDSIYDIERVMSKISYQSANCKDLLILKNSIKNLPKLSKILLSSNSNAIKNIAANLDELVDIYDLIDISIDENASHTVTEGGIIKSGFDDTLDEMRKSSVEGNRDLIEYEKNEKDKTKIPKLKVSFNKNIGYYIEISKSSIDKVPEHYNRIQTLKNYERYTTVELNIIADKILSSSSDTKDLEYDIFCKIRESVAESFYRIKQTTDVISSIDALNAFSKLAVSNNYVRPVFNDQGYIFIEKGRHPVVESSIGRHKFVANNSLIGKNKIDIQVITGPNTSGKSTYMRQVALIILMAQIGSFVPANACDISIFDAIFTRIGASDNLAKGDSTFMVEMKEMANIIDNATEKSFVVLDEVGRGTSMNDGFSIAKSIIEYISKEIRCKTLFATHYHELTDLENEFENIENLKVVVQEDNGDIVFLREIVKGKTDRSYGIHVAKLSGLPEDILFRAQEILYTMDKEELSKYDFSQKLDFVLDTKREIFIKEIESVDIENLTPISSMEVLNRFIEKAKEINND